MKRIVSIVASCLAMAVITLTPAVAVYAETGSSSSNSGSGSSSSGSNTSSSTSDKTSSSGTDSAKDKLEARLKEYKATLKTNLDAAAKTRIESRCVASQGTIKTFSDKLNGSSKTRTDAYSGIVTRLKDLSAKLKAKGVNTTQLDTDLDTLNGKVTDFGTKLTDYKAALSDLAATDCKTDPTAFKAALEAARTDQKAMLTAAQGIRDYIKSPIKTELETIRKQLAEDKDKPAGATN